MTKCTSLALLVLFLALLGPAVRTQFFSGQHWTRPLSM